MHIAHSNRSSHSAAQPWRDAQTDRPRLALNGGTPTICQAHEEEAEILARLFDMADGELSAPRWEAAARPGPSPYEAGAAEIISGRPRQSLRDARVAKVGTTIAGAVLSYRMTPKTARSEGAPYDRLKAHVAGAWYIDSLAVAEEWRRRGVGASLLETAAQAARVAGCTSLTLLVYDTNAAARALYSRLGFIPG